MVALKATSLGILIWSLVIPPIEAQKIVLIGSSAAVRPSPVTYVQTSTADNVTGGGATQTFTVSAMASGHCGILAVASGSSTSSLTISSLTLSNISFTSLLAAQTVGGVASDRFYAYSVCAAGTGGTTLSITYSSAPTVLDTIIYMVEFAGLPASLVIDCYGWGTTTSTAVNSNNVTQCTSTIANDILVAFVVVFATGGTIPTQPGGAYINLSFYNPTAAGSGIQGNYALNSSVGNQSPAWALSSSARNGGFVVAIQPPSVAIGIL